MSRPFRNTHDVLRHLSANHKAAAEWRARNWDGVDRPFVPRVLPPEEQWRIVGTYTGTAEMTFPPIPDDSPEFALDCGQSLVHSTLS